MRSSELTSGNGNPFAVLDAASVQSIQSERTPWQTSLLRLLEAAHSHDLNGVLMYRALPHLEDFHRATNKWRIVDGSNRSSKTFSCMAEAARAWQGMDPYDKYVRTCGNALVVAKELDDVQRLWRTLTESSFSMIRDEITRLWRAVRPDPGNPLRLDPYDEAYKEKWREAPPLLPLKNATVAWENVAKGIPRYVTIKSTGWKILFRSSNGKPPQGDHYHFVHIDEQLENPDFYQEANRGLVAISESPKHWPKGVWSATSQTANLQLYELREAADSGKSFVAAFHTTIDQNPFIPDEEKRSFYESLDEGERDVRYFGKYAIAIRHIYRMYDPMGVHGYDPMPIPRDWSRWLFLDPGRDHCATILVAVDPEEKHAWVYDAFDLRQSSARQWARQIADREDGVKFEGMVIDSHAGNQTPMSFDEKVSEQYWKELQAVNVSPKQMGPHFGFFPGTADREAREEALVRWLEPRVEGEPFAGLPVLKVCKGVCPELDRQIKRASTDPEKPNRRMRHKRITDDLLDCLEYAAAFRPRYYTPTASDTDTANDDWVYQRLQKKKQLARAKHLS